MWPSLGRIAVFLSLAAFPAVGNTQNCPPTVGAPPDWCRPHASNIVPGPLSPLQPDSGGRHDTFGGGGVPAIPRQPNYPVLSQQSGYGGQNSFQSICYIDNAGNGCQILSFSPIPNRVPCSCGQYNGFTQ